VGGSAEGFEYHGCTVFGIRVIIEDHHTARLTFASRGRVYV
jgi:hypothetical protein